MDRTVVIEGDVKLSSLIDGDTLLYNALDGESDDSEQELVIEGEVCLESSIDGDTLLSDTLDGESGVFYAVSAQEHETYEGAYVVIPMVDTEQTLLTADKIMSDDVTVRAIPYYETSNPYGKTIYIGEDFLNG